jgi:hypothetical protein
MNVAFSKGTLDIWHKTGMGDLSQLFKLGNKYRIEDDKLPLNITHFLKGTATNEFITVISRNTGLEKKDILLRTGKGRTGKTMAQLHFLVYCAEKLNPQFHYEVIDCFVENRLLMKRDDGGNAFKALNVAIDAYLPSREGKSNQGIYIHCAKLIRNKVFGDIGTNWIVKTHGNIWNSEYATDRKQLLRGQIEDKLISFLEVGIVKDWEHLKELINKL